MKTAIELNITDEEWTALQAVAAGLASGEYVEANGKVFNMGITCEQRGCGTVGCIGGWVGREMGLTKSEASGYVFDISSTDSLNKLYYPNEFLWSRITPAIASDAIYNFLNTGHPDFEALLAAQEDANSFEAA